MPRLGPSSVRRFAPLLAACGLVVAAAPAQAVSIQTSPPSGKVRPGTTITVTVTATAGEFANPGCTGGYEYTWDLGNSKGSGLTASTTIHVPKDQRYGSYGAPLYWLGSCDTMYGRKGFQGPRGPTGNWTVDSNAPASPTPKKKPAGPNTTVRDDCKLALLGSSSYGRSQAYFSPAELQTIANAHPQTADGKLLQRKLIEQRNHYNAYQGALSQSEAAYKSEVNRIAAAQASGQYYSREQSQALDARDEHNLQLGLQYINILEANGKVIDRLRKAGCREGKPIAANPREIRFSPNQKRIFEYRRKVWVDTLAKYEQTSEAICFVNSAKEGLAKPTIKDFFTKFAPGQGLDLLKIPSDACSAIGRIGSLLFEYKRDLNADLAADPPRFDFRTPTHRPKIPVLKATAPGYKAAGAALLGLMRASIAESLTGQAMLAAMERAQGAELSREPKWALKQIGYARSLLRRERKATAARAAAQRRAVKVLRKAGMAAKLEVDAATAAQTPAIVATWAPTFMRQMLAWGTAPADALRALDQLYTTPVKPGTVKFPDVLGAGSSRKQTAAELNALKGLDRRLKAAAKRIRKRS